jgi:hypothetical protein
MHWSPPAIPFYKHVIIFFRSRLGYEQKHDICHSEFGLSHLNMMISTSIHFPESDIILFFFLVEYSVVCMYIFFILSLAIGCLYRFHILATINSAAIT